MSSIPRFAPGGAAPRNVAQPARGNRDRSLATVFAVIYAAVWLFFAIDPSALDSPEVIEQQKLQQKIAETYGGAAAQGPGKNQPSDTYRTIKLVMLGLGAAVLIARMRETRGLLRRVNRPLLVFLGLVPLSYLWSIDPSNTLAHFISVLCFVVFLAAAVLVGWHAQRFQNILRPVVSLLLLGSIALYLYSPYNAIEHGDGVFDAWRGLTVQKNTFGALSSIAAVFWMHALLAKQGKVLVTLAGVIMSVGCVLMSRSSTSLISTLFVFFFMTLLLHSPRALRRYMPYITGSFAVLVVTYAVTVLNVVPGLGIILEPVFAFTGKDGTFTNRSQIWDIVKDQIQNSPLLGCGYGAYWNGPDLAAASHIFMVKMYFYPGEAHNGYLEITNDLGFLGLVLLLAFLVVYVRQALALMRIDRAQGVLYLSLFFQQAIVNLSESTWLQINSPNMFMIIILASFALARSAQLRASSARAAPPPMAAIVPPSMPPLRTRFGRYY